MEQLLDLHNELKVKFIEGANERKELYNKVLELKGSCTCALMSRFL